MGFKGGRVERLGFLRQVDGGLDVFVVTLVKQDLGIEGIGRGVVRVKLDGLVHRQHRHRHIYPGNPGQKP